MALPDHMEGEDVLITFEREASTTIQQVEGKVLSWNIGGGEAPTEEVPSFGGRTFNIQKPREKFKLEFEVVINDTLMDFVSMGSATYGAGTAMTTSTDTKINRLIRSTDQIKRWRVIFWFQSRQYHKIGTTNTVPAKNQSLYRLICADVKAVSFEKEFSADGYMKGKLTLEFSASDSTGYANLIQQEGLYTGTTSTKLAPMSSTTVTGGIAKEARGTLNWNTTTKVWILNATYGYRYPSN